MKINEIKINSYGKIKNKSIILKDGINIIYGENERGKSTLLSSIVSFFYGVSKNKRGKEISDYDKYKPWEGDDFSGKISYNLDNSDSYEVFREFGKKNSKIYNKDMEEVSNMYSTDKTLGSQFFIEQTGVDENTFISTVVSFQNSVEIDNQTQNILLQKIANATTTGDDGISYKKAIEKLNKKQLDEIGTSRSQGKPINIAMNDIQRLTAINQDLKQYEEYKYEIEDRKYGLQKELDTEKEKNEFLTRLNNLKQEQSIEEKKLKYNEEKIDEFENKIQALMNEKEILKKELIDVKKVDKESVNVILYLMGTICSIIGAVSVYLATKSSIAFLLLIIGCVCIALYVSKRKKVEKYNKKKTIEFEKNIEYNKNIEKKMYEIDAQLEVFEKSQKNEITAAECIKNEIIKNIETRKDNLKNQFLNRIDFSSINYFINSDNLQNQIDQNNRIINEKNIEIHKLDLDKQNILPRLEELAENEEKISANKELYNELVKKNEAINMAKEIIENSYKKMKSDIAPRFTEKLSKNVAIITNNKYKRIILNEEEGILVELDNGEYKNANLLSRGTIEQLYLAFRLAIIEDISSENMPIIFDEIFAYFDDERLRETLKNLDENYSDKHQIILFTCTKREEEALKDLHINYNLINL